MIRRSTISGNTGAQLGGGIYNDAHTVDLSNSTISGNSAFDGGGVYVLTGTVSLDYSTVANNHATTQGGGIYNAKATTFESSIVAGNDVGGNGANGSADCYAASPLTFAGYSVFGEGTGCGANGRYDQTTTSATVFTTLLQPLADNSGATETHALANGSIAFDAGNPDYCPDTDQRGVSRPRFNDCDSGAYETEFAYVFLPIILK